ncbi:MAG TPA: MmcQ/YjbR family DNA-binding protein [Thermoanaerobaculia bacterium]|nr:MmcQ/YjbR family DNA-binding protein [Thermoanaerobaculia bacterium]
MKKPLFDRVRQLCLSLPETFEKLSHGEPTFFVKKRTFVMFSTNHHGDGNYAIVCNVPEGAQEILTKSDPDHFYIPPYVGVAGWVGVRLDRGVAWQTVASIVNDAYRFTLAKQRKGRATSSRRTRSARTRD